MGAHFTITEDKKAEIRQLIKMYSIRESARFSGVSYYTAWCVASGKDKKKSLTKTCPITGFKI